MVAPSTFCQTGTGTVVSGNPCHLSVPGAAIGLGDWAYLGQFVAPTSAWENKPGVRDLQTLSALLTCGRVNLDFYPVAVTSMPTLPGEAAPATAQSLLHYMRLHWNDILTPAEFNPMTGLFCGPDWEASNRATWFSDNPVGTIIEILPGGSSWNIITEMSVVCSEHVAGDDAGYWIFSTLTTEQDGHHPVSGNRQFGHAIRRAGTVLPRLGCDNRGPRPLSSNAFWTQPADQDITYLYTRGADRATAYYDTPGINEHMVFNGGHEMWRIFQRNTQAFIRAHGGEASFPGYISNRWEWPWFRDHYVNG